MTDPECDCGTTYEEEDGMLIHFEDCAIFRDKLILW